MDTRVITVDCHHLRPQLAAAYLRVSGEEAIFIEVNTAHARPHLLRALAEAGRRPEDVRYVIVTHAHLDHAAGASALLEVCPNATLLAHPRAARNLVDPSRLVASARRVYGDAVFEREYGRIDPIPQERVRELEDGATVEAGGGTLRMLHVEGHARHHFVVHDEAQDAVFTGDAFGLVYPALQRGPGRVAFPSTSPIDYDGPQAVRAIERIMALKPRTVYLTHFGGYHDIATIAAELSWWLQEMAAAVEQCVREGRSEPEPFLRSRLEALLSAQLQRAGAAVTAEDQPLLELDLMLNTQGLAVAVARQLKAAAG